MTPSINSSTSTVSVPRGADTLGYARVSTEQQAGETKSSLREQPRALIERAVQLGRRLDARAIFVDAGISGATAEGRPAFMALLHYCEANPRAKGDGIILVLNDSRFGRFHDPEEATHWRFVLKRLGWIVRFVEGDDVADGVARGVLRFIGSAQASEYRANLQRTAKRASRATAEEGRWQNKAPIGYRRLATRPDGAQRVLEAGQRKSDDEITRLTPGPIEEQQIIRFVFESYAGGKVTLRGLVRMMAKQWPSKKWSTATLNAVLKNPAYTGDVVWCRRPHDKAEAKLTRIRPRDEWVVVTDAHPALISRDLFLTVQGRLARNKTETRATAGGYPLSGFIVCSTCGCPFTGGGGKRGPHDDPDRYRFYRDASADKRVNPCPGPVATLRKRWLEPTVVAEVAKVVSDPRIQSVIIEELDRALALLFDGTSSRRGELAAERETLIARRQRIVDAIGQGTLAAREASASLVAIRSQISATEDQIDRLKFTERRVSAIHELRDRLVALARDFKTTALRATGPDLRELIRPWLASASHDKQTRILTLKIRRIPDVFGLPIPTELLNHASRARKTRDSITDNVVTRRIRVPANNHGAPSRRQA